MIDREKLEWAAKACGIAHVDYTGTHYCGSLGLEKVNENGQHIGAWNPLTDQGDSDRMACKLEIELRFRDSHIWASPAKAKMFMRTVAHDGTNEDRRRAVREARLLVAAEIGRAMP